jgi:N-acylneuraminate cytidylyltransferase
MNIAVIPARGGSKRIPRKNIRPFAGKPMIVWSIDAARESGLFAHVIVTTDDPEIAEVAREAGAAVPFVRPKELSDDHTPTRPVVQHAIREVARLHGMPERVCCIYATAPFVAVADLEAGARLLAEEKCSYAFAAASFAYPIQRALKRTADGGVAMWQPEHRTTRSQDLEEAYHDAGQFYWGTAQAYLGDTPMFSEAARMVVIPRYRVHDIDTMEDWERAELVFSALHARTAPKVAASA